jgi:multidrug resistance efflux pump
VNGSTRAGRLPPVAVDAARRAKDSLQVSEDGSAQRPSLFRKEALDHHMGYRYEGEVLRLQPRWTHWTFGLLVAVFVASVLYAILGTMDEYATGIALVRVDGRAELTARQAGIVQSVEVQPGQRVGAGQILVRFHGDVAEAERLDQEFDLQLMKTLANPSDESARQSLTSLRAARELARARLEEKLLRAPDAGVVSDVRIRTGQSLAAGDPVLSLVTSDASFRVTAVLPGQYRPRLRAGMPLRIEMTGYHYAYREVIIESIGDEVVGPTEIRRTLGPEIGDTLPVTGPVVLVTARLPSRTFSAQGREYAYFEGMQGRAEARVGTESIAASLIPGLKAFFE